MMEYLEDWLSRKSERPQVTIREKGSSRFKFTRPLGARGQFAVVHLRGEPAADIGFTSVAAWPSPECDYTMAVLDGILDDLFAVNLGPVAARVQFTLERIEWHDVDSCAVAFYHAGRGAVREILGSNQFHDNIDYSGFGRGSRK
jgi:hypothetical protein